MSTLPQYTYTGPVDHIAPVDRTKLAGLGVVLTGGANGMGEETVRQFAAANAFVTFADMDEERGRQVEAEINLKYPDPRVQFVKCDIRSWSDQVALFEAATKNGRVLNSVIANAGISRSSVDSLWKLDDPNGPPTEPNLNIVRTNIDGTLYTFKLAVHYFRRQPEGHDRSFTITGSLVTWVDSPANWEYTCSKYALRGLMRTVRRNSHQQGIRINYVAPCYIRSAIRTAAYEKTLLDQGVRFGEVEDVATCMARLTTDRSINGHSLIIVPRSVAEQGYMDAGLDDFTEDGFFKSTQEVQLKIIKDLWFDGEALPIYHKQKE